MRDNFISELLNHAKVDSKILLVTGDLGFGVLDKFSKELPLQFINAGVAEQNMTGLATGLALEGFCTFTYSIGNFPTLRCLEQIRNDTLYHNASVNIVSVGGGFSYGNLGMSHHATEDVAIMRSLPGLRIFAPCDVSETIAVVKQLIDEPGPSYVRLDKSMCTNVGIDEYDPGKIRQILAGSDVAIVSYGGIVQEACEASEILGKHGVDCSVYSAHTLKPFDSEGLINIASTHKLLMTLEEHTKFGGLASLAAETFLENKVFPNAFKSLGLPDKFATIVGSQKYLRSQYSLNSEAIVNAVLSHS